MTVRYQLLMGFGFTFSFLALTSIIYLETLMKGYGQLCIALIDGPLSLIWIITLIICRSIHSGSIVSGNNCSDPRGCTSEHGYLPYTSKFILGWYISVLIVWVLLFAYIKYKTPKMKEADGTAISPLNPDYLAKYEHVGDEPLGRGECGTAWKVKVKGSTDGKIYVAKETVGEAELCKATFCPEQRALAKVNHPKLVNMIESFGEGESGSVMITNFMKGMNVNHYINGRPGATKSVSMDEYFDWCPQMIECLHYLHTEAFMIHRNLHNGNWMIDDEGNLSLIDFDFALYLGPNGISADSVAFYLFASPEQCHHKPSGYDGDIWYMGVIFYMMLT
jgi:hypothetical protein